MIDFLNRNIFQPHPELLVFLVIALGFLLGKVRYRAIALGAVTGCLVAGLVLGAQFKVDIDDTVKNLFFIMFLFALGYRVGPQFFRGLKKDGLPQVVNAVVVCVTGLLVSWLFASLLGYGPGLGAGLMSGALTQSAAIGVAQDAIGTLPGLSSAEVKTQENLVAVGYAVTYPLGTILCAMLLANVLPKLYRRDLAKESAELAAELDAPDESPDEGAGYYEVVLRAYRVDRPDLVGRSVADFEDQQKALGRRIYLTGVRREGTVLEHDQSRTLRLGDTVAVSAIRGDLVDFDPVTHIGAEADDVELLGYRTETLHVVASEKAHLGRTVAEVRREPFMVGVYIDKLYRAGAEFPYRLSTPLERGDTVILTGPERLVGPAGKALGKPVPTSFATDMVWVGLGIFLGGCLGIPALTAGGVPISLSTSGGGLIMGLVFGWIRGKYPTYGNVPPGAQWFMDTLGLCLFVAVVGINAGPGFTSGLATAGWGLLVFGAVATVVPLIVGFLVGHYVQKIRFPVLMGVLAGGQTTTAAIGAVNETSKSQIPTLGYTIPYAVGNVLLTVWGAVIVILNH
ncbi:MULTISPECIES: aspartate-alanine antiporter [Streptomyces]|uniref:Aspartate-alanine antiporter n=1 Tax=Streptomyces microflavus TaxID=1919 RepID=A0A6N9VGZ9_STRMI|nr:MULTISPECIES: aspartate-alanine antiporter [Streptomyces]MBW3358604.1 aspartate-alanine antiporter [Streptomyces sp. 09ZI22]MEE1731753.1 aspartate-alanine antiporter [Streptomyces sp. BE282]NEB71687.1 aspartate-alanine antiporter [Streptomyces microflavus]OXY90042.1 aspartate-alanine antiporter [Streptomyces sp. 2R]QKW43160.1 aspartate-alanine antiporter [Streptomyces microflavus]